MAKARLVNTHFWDDAFIRKLPAGDKLLFLYLITNPCTNIAGAYEITMDRMKFDTGMDEKRLTDAIRRLSEADKITYKDDWICVHNFIKNQSKSESVEKGIVEALKYCPNWVKDTLSTRYQTLLTRCDISNLIKSNLTKRKFRPKPEVEAIFEEWKTVLKKKSSLDAKRHKLLADRLAEGYSVADLKLVPHGALKSSWHIGDNPKKVKYLEIKTLYRDAEQVDKFIELAKEPQVVVTTTNGTNSPTQRELQRRDRELEKELALVH